ncbi:cell division protein FtsQ/DivIB [Shewanella salipaludis]|uniref:Cell division protein FtsQ n=1 Tax=Shewanella salipaludis TaxID=2723052 RepID=A0A972G159_9GAMM|nr:FtsQ-type POTRA domain-containing protein [Shewanella salipaludis]
MSWSDKRRHWQQKLLQLDWYLWLGLVFLFAVLLGLIAAGRQLHSVLNDADKLPIEAVAIKGERLYTSDREIQQALQSLMQRSFFSADVTQVQQTLEALPWVYSASVRREWPAKLKVYLQEQQPIAHWNGDAWLNVQGEVFQAAAPPGLEKLPLLAGPDDMGSEVLTTYQLLESLLKINGFELASLSLSPRHAWHAMLDNGILLDLGREDNMARVQRFIDVYPILAKQSKAIATVDLRYDTGLAVGWDDAQQESR